MKTVKSTIIRLPNKDENKFYEPVSQSKPEYIFWYKDDEDGYVALTVDEALDVVNFLDKQCKTYLKDNQVVDVKKKEIPNFPMHDSQITPYKLSEMVPHKKILGFKLYGHIPHIADNL